MDNERYPGEQRALRLFLQELRPQGARCGENSLLVHAIRRALHTGDLDHLRHARTLFNHLPREQRQAFSAACVTPAAEPRPPAHELLERYSDREPEPFVSFERRGEPGASAAHRGHADPRAAAGERGAGHGQPGHAAEHRGQRLRRIAG